MPTLTLNGAKLHYEDSGRGAETIVFAHGLLWSGRMFDDQVAALRDRYRCVSFDFRGQGQSEVTASGYDMDTLSDDAAALIGALGVGPVHFVGLSMGGFVGMRLAARKPELIRSLALLETSSGPEAPGNVPKYRALGLVARWLSLRLVARPVMQIMFGQRFLTDSGRSAVRAAWRARLLENDPVGVTRALGGVITRQGLEGELAKIHVPTLVVVGDQDVATPPPLAERLRDAIAGAKLVVIPGAGHSSSVEESAAVNAALAAFLASLDDGPRHAW